MAWDWQSAMDAKLTAFPGWHFHIHCARCRLVVQLDLDRLRNARPDLHVAQAVIRFRCSRCGELPGSVALSEGYEGDGRGERQRIDLLP